MSVADGIAFCQQYLGYPYSIRPSRFGKTDPVHFDCSGYAWRYCDEASLSLPREVSTTFAMVAYAEDNPDLGLIVTKDYALTREGVLCLRGGRTPSGINGAGGHVAVSDGEGGTYEAKGTRYGVVRDVIGKRFDFFMVPPGYGSEDSKPEPPPPPEEFDEMAVIVEGTENATVTYRVEDDGVLAQYWYDGTWHPVPMTPGGWCRKGATPTVLHSETTPGRVDVYAPHRDKGIVHTWYLPGAPGWGYEQIVF